MGIVIPSSVIEIIRKSRKMVILTGAGISAESGIATFRDPNEGLWSKQDPKLLCTPSAFRSDPALVWGWYEARRYELLNTQPNPAHFAVAKLAALVPQTTLITQNVDDLHERAGSEDVVHLHGRILDSLCFACARPHAHRATANFFADPIEPPRCRHCNGRIRPGVVWFGEQLPSEAIERAVIAAKHCDCFISVGTSEEVDPAATLPDVALKAGAAVIHVNTDPWCRRRANEYLLHGRAGEILPALVKQAFSSVSG